MKKLILFALILTSGLSLRAQENISEENLKKHVYFLASDSLEGRGLATQSGKIAAEYIADQFKSAGLDMIGDSYFHPFFARVGQTMLEGRNVVGLVRGNDPKLKNEYILLGAHYDHVSFRFKDGEKVVYNGADDNASGTAAVIELGRALADNQDKLKRSVILVAFDAEESGLIGSRQFVKKNTVPTDQIKIMMSIDMVGRLAESNSLIMGAMEGLTNGVDLLMPIAEEYDLKIKKTGDEVFNRTDTKPFGDIGIPAVYVSTGIIGPYHKPEDDRETLDYPGMYQITSLLFEFTSELANSKELEPAERLISQAETKGQPFIRFGYKTALGGSSNVYPDNYFKGKSRFSGEEAILAQLKITRNIFLQPELQYSLMGSKHADGKLRLHSICAPLSIIVASNMEPMSGQRFFGTVGAYYSYHFKGTMNKQDLDFTNKFSQTEYGITYGLGIEIMSSFFGINFKHGLTNLNKEENSDRIRNRGVYFTIGQFFR